jgi:hypothetical protein
MDRFEKVISLLIILNLGFLIFCITEYNQISFWGKAIAATLSNMASLLSLYLFLKSE